MEQEAKYRLTERVKPKQVEQLDWNTYTLGERVSKRLVDTIFDTQEWVLSQHKYTLRIRQDGNLVFLTLKSKGSVHGALHSRNEIEYQIDSISVRKRAAWPQDIREPIEALIGEDKLKPLMTVHNKRRVWPVFKNELEVAEIALDRGSIEAAGRSMDFHELEIELKGQGTVEDIEAIGTFLQATLPVEIEALSKRERGGLLLEQKEHVRDITAMKQINPMTPTADLAEAGRSMVAAHAEKLHEMLPIARIGEDPEGVHKARVSIRRMRAILAALTESVYDPEQIKPLRRHLKKLADSLGEVRDPDVFLIELQKYLDPLPEQAVEQMQPLVDMMKQRREQGRIHLLNVLDKTKTAKTLDQLDNFVTTPGAGVRSFEGADYERPRKLVRYWAGSMLWNHYEIVRAHEVNLSEAPTETLHELRIHIKHLRYLIELFMDALAEQAKSLHEQLVAAQDHLGEIQDAEVAIQLVDELLLNYPESQALHVYRANRSQRRTELINSAGTGLSIIFGVNFRRRLGAIIAKL